MVPNLCGIKAQHLQKLNSFNTVGADDFHPLLFLTMNLSQFQQIISSSDKPIIVDFWAPWCMPCKVTKPILEKLGREFKETVEFLPIDANHSHDVLEHFRVRGIPTVLAFRNGKMENQITGAQNESVYRLMFKALATGKEVKIPMSAIGRTFRLGAGAVLIMYGVTNSNWLVAGIGGIIAFLGIYDRCPIWKAITGFIKQRFS